MFLVRSSKFRHIFGSPAKKEQCYEAIRITKDAHDSSFCAVNPKFIAIVLESAGGGVFVVLPVEQTGRAMVHTSRVCGHRGPVTDIKWNPFNDNVIASASDDTTIKLWHIPNGGLLCNLNEWLVDLHGHTKKVSYIEWHPTAADILLSAGADFRCILWNTDKAECIRVIAVHNDTIFSVSWNLDGSRFATTCKDKKIRIIDPRQGTVISQGTGHIGPKASKLVFIDKQLIFTTGFSRMSERQFAIWNSENLTKPLASEDIDVSSGILIPYYDFDTKVMFLAGKGDGNIRYFEIVESPPYVHYLSQFQSGSPQRGLGMMPKRGLDTSRCEIARFYKLHTLKDLCEPISMIVPRKSELFQEDIYPPTAAPTPSLSADEWLSGLNRDPILLPLQSTQIVANKTAKRFADDTNMSSKRTAPSVSAPSVIDASDVNVSMVTRRCATSTGPTPLPAAGAMSVESVSHEKLPASLKNIQRLSSVENQPTYGSDWRRYEAAAAAKRVINNNNYCTDSAHSNSSKDLVMSSSSNDQLSTTNSFKTDSSVPGDESELRKAFISQRREITNLREQLSIRDRRVQQLEDEVKFLRMSAVGHRDSSTRDIMSVT
jgi:hypothetical protein